MSNFFLGFLEDGVAFFYPFIGPTAPFEMRQ